IDPDGDASPDGGDTYASGEIVDSNGDLDDTGQASVDGVDPIGKLTTSEGALSGLFEVTKDAGADGEQSLTHAFKLVLSSEGLASTLSVTPEAVGGNPGLPDVLTISFSSVGGHIVEGRVGGEFGPIALRITLVNPTDPGSAHL